METQLFVQVPGRLGKTEGIRMRRGGGGCDRAGPSPLCCGSLPWARSWHLLRASGRRQEWRYPGVQ
eukprot:9175964-Alexandrium_andersonii.AAC.1